MTGLLNLIQRNSNLPTEPNNLLNAECIRINPRHHAAIHRLADLCRLLILLPLLDQNLRIRNMQEVAAHLHAREIPVELLELGTQTSRVGGSSFGHRHGILPAPKSLHGLMEGPCELAKSFIFPFFLFYQFLLSLLRLALMFTVLLVLVSSLFVRFEAVGGISAFLDGPWLRGVDNVCFIDAVDDRLFSRRGCCDLGFLPFSI